jgi:hypothetical protein
MVELARDSDSDELGLGPGLRVRDSESLDPELVLARALGHCCSHLACICNYICSTVEAHGRDRIWRLSQSR